MNWGSIFKLFTTLDYGNVADWVSAAATFAATIVALWLGRRRPKSKLKFVTSRVDNMIWLKAINVGSGVAKATIVRIEEPTTDTQIEATIVKDKLVELHPYEFTADNIAGFKESNYNKVTVIVMETGSTVQYNVHLKRTKSGDWIVAKTRIDKSGLRKFK